MTDSPKIDTTLQRLHAEALAHTGEARLLIAGLAKARGVVMPSTPSVSKDQEMDLDTSPDSEPPRT